MTAKAERPDVALVTMPFAPAYQPSLALSLLKQIVTPGRASVFYETLRFASVIGFELYTGITGGLLPTTHLVGEWIFAEAAFGSDEARDEAYVAEFLSGRAGGNGDVDFDSPAGVQLLADLRECRTRVDSYLEGALSRVLGMEPQIVGFTSVFQQQVASLALARRIKQARPDTTIVMGGANCEGAMGFAVLRNFSYIDVVVPGEGELPFRELVDRLTRGQPVVGVAGAVTRRDLSPLAVRSDDKPRSIEMDALPIPDFDDFFDQRLSLGVPTDRTPFLLFESARGCWWGALRHCTFCGLNGEGMTFRSKSPDRAVAELCELTGRYPGLPVYAVDNIIDRDYFVTFLPQLAASSCDARIFYEVKANLTKDQLRLLKDAGVQDIQPGLESLHDSILRIMRKGVTAIGNVQLLKWCAEIGLRPHWNLLWGFPGEPVTAFGHMAALIPKLAHLQPPSGSGTIRLDRFSPNFDQADELGFHDVRPVPAYQAIYGLGEVAIADLAYFFAFDDAEIRRAEPHIKELEQAVAQWQSSHESSGMWLVDNGESLVVWDMRLGIAPRDTHLSGLERELYLACDRCCSPKELAATISRSHGSPVSTETVIETLAPLLDSGLVMSDGRRYLALAVPLGDRQLPSRFLARVARELVLEAQGATRESIPT